MKVAAAPKGAATPSAVPSDAPRTPTDSPAGTPKSISLPPGLGLKLGEPTPIPTKSWALPEKSPAAKNLFGKPSDIAAAAPPESLVLPKKTVTFADKPETKVADKPGILHLLTPSYCVECHLCIHSHA